WLHVVDLDGAFSGRAENLEALAEICGAGIPVQLGGGIRTLAEVEDRLEKRGVARVILGTVALENPSLVAQACRAYPGKIACGMDARDGMVAVRGWVAESQMTTQALALRMRDAGVEWIIYTDIARDGMLGGPNVEATRALVQNMGLRVIGSGGVGSLADIRALRDAGCAGAITGKALYEGRFTLEAACKAAEEEL
ncbi:MAG: HisA/HisF-related TIM barrel protein, partial [Clostridia bacterium]